MDRLASYAAGYRDNDKTAKAGLVTTQSANGLLSFEIVEQPNAERNLPGQVRINGVNHHITLIPVEGVGSAQGPQEPGRRRVLRRALRL